MSGNRLVRSDDLGLCLTYCGQTYRPAAALNAGALAAGRHRSMVELLSTPGAPELEPLRLHALAQETTVAEQIESAANRPSAHRSGDRVHVNPRPGTRTLLVDGELWTSIPPHG